MRFELDTMDEDTLHVIDTGSSVGDIAWAAAKTNLETREDDQPQAQQLAKKIQDAFDDDEEPAFLSFGEGEPMLLCSALERIDAHELAEQLLDRINTHDSEVADEEEEET